LLLAIVLSMAILFGTPYVYQKLNLAPPPEEVPAKGVEEVVVQRDEQPRREAQATPVDTSGALPPTSAEPREFDVETKDLRLTFTTRGAFLTSVQLKRYVSAAGEGLELVPQGLPAAAGGTLLLRSPDEELNRLLVEAVYEVAVEADSGFKKVTFSFRTNEIEATKGVYVPENGYELSIEADLRRNGKQLPYVVQVGPGIGDGSEDGSSDFQDPAIAFYQNGSVERFYVDDFEGGESVAGGLRWGGLDSKYFAQVVVQPDGIDRLWQEKMERPPGDETGEEEAAVLLRAAVELEDTRSFSLYLGPKSGDELSRADPTLNQLINFGEWLGVLVKPLLVGLKFIHQYVGNYGWSIILLTFLINLALFPFRYKQMASMQKMSAVQPKLKSIQDKYKRMKRDDPRKQQMNAEVMALYKEHGVNPLGGCLPLLLQMPILFAFYRMLYTSIELRGAPFMLWIHDLSKPDPYYITPIVMGATMVAQQKMTPATGDPAQRRMMMFLPIIFTFFFLRVSSGLAIYFLFSNLFGMLLQAGLQKFKPELTAKGRKAGGKQKRKK